MKEKAFQILAIAAVIIATVSLMRPAGSAVLESESALDHIRAAGEIRVCYINYPPFTIQDAATGKTSGIFPEAMMRIADRMGVSVRNVESTWATIVPDLTSRRCDVNAAGVFPLIERAYGGVIFTDPLGFIGNNGVVKDADQRFDSIDDLNSADVTIAVTEGEQGHIYAQKYLPKATLNIISSADISLAFLDVQTGRADIALADSLTIDLYFKEHPDSPLRVAFDEPYIKSGITWVVREDDTKALNFFNNALGVLKANGDLGELFEKYNAEGYGL